MCGGVVVSLSVYLSVYILPGILTIPESIDFPCERIFRGLLFVLVFTKVAPGKTFDKINILR